MKRLFLKRYNIAYDFFLTRYFNDAGIDFDDSSKFDDIRSRRLFASRMKGMPAEEKLFASYVSSWRMHPEARPVYKGLFEKALGQDHRPNVEQLLKLERELPEGRGKLIFSEKEIATAFSDFYHKDVARPLKDAMDGGMDGELMLWFFTQKESEKIPLSKSKHDEEWVRTVNQVAGSLLSQLEAVNPEMIEREIHQILDEHDRTQDHMRHYPNADGNGEHWSCEHYSENVRLSGHRDFKNDIDLILQPTRGFGVSEYLMGETDWEYVVFPQFWSISET